MCDSVMELALPQQAVLGEGLLWFEGRWWWTDIESASFHTWKPGARAATSCVLPDRLGCFSHTKSGNVLMGLAKRLALATLAEDMSVQSLRPLVPVDANEHRTRINDGRTDRSGNFVFGTMNEAPDKRPIGSFYQYSARHGLRRLALPAVAISNSVCFSLDGKTMYFCDTTTQTILQCDYDADAAQTGNVRTFARIEEPMAWPDGSIIDSEGCLWNAQWGAGRVVRYSPEGRPMSSAVLPAAHAACPAIGGAALDELMVVTARLMLNPEQLAAQPHSGSLFGMKLNGALGVPDKLFDDELMVSQPETRKRRQ